MIVLLKTSKTHRE